MWRLASLSILAGFALSLILTTLAFGQVTDVTDTTSTPIEGAGHDYIKGLSETVNPANGSVSIRLQVPVAKSRGLTIPFSFGYDSNSYRHIKPGYYPYFGTTIWATNTGSLGTGGWLYTFPQLNLEDWGRPVSVVTGYNNQGPIYTVYYCQYDSSYVFRDGSGGVHALGIGASWYYDSSAAPYCGSYSATTGGDPQVRAALTRQLYQNYYEPDPVAVYEADGTVYYFPSFGVGGQDATSVSALPSYIEDRNGNMVVWSGSGYKDALGRSLFSYTGFGPAGQTNTVTVSGLSYQVTWKTTSANYSVYPQWAGSTNGPNSSNDTCFPVPVVNDTQTVVSQITLPNAQAYRFYYGNDTTPNRAATNPYGLLSEIDYPSGGWVQYRWVNNTLNEIADYPGLVESSGLNCSTDPTAQCPNPVPDGCGYLYQSPVVSSRLVGFGGSSTPSLTQVYSYSTTWSPPLTGNTLGETWTSKSTNVTTTDTVLGKSFLTTYNYLPITAPRVPFSNSTVNQLPVESSTSYYDWGNTTTPVRVVTKTWYDQYDLKSEITQEAGKTSQITYCYVGTNCAPNWFAQLQEKDEYDFGASTPTRRTVTSYQSFSGTLGTIADAPCQTIVYDGGTNRYAETDYYYDGGTTLCANETQATTVPQWVSGLPTGSHDETLFGSGVNTPRGNLTQKVHWASTGTSPTTTYTYDSAGQLLSATDACGNSTCADMTGTSHTTNFSYANTAPDGTSNFTVLSGGQNVSYTPSGNLDAYLTQITDAAGHTEYFKFDFNNGQLTQSSDPNGQSTSYVYNDPLARPTQVSYPDSGQTEYAYNDTAPSSSITTCQNISGTANSTCSASAPASGWKTSITRMDGMGHVVQTQLVSDPSGADLVDISYDGEGHILTRLNPHRSSASATDGTTTYAYDALGRTNQVTEPDGSIWSTTYDQTNANSAGLCTTVADETGKLRQSCADALGRLTSVWEDPGASPHLNYETDYMYDALNNLLSVTQKGGSTQSSQWRTRSFTYDSLSRLLCAANPETKPVICPTSGGTFPAGAITYSYDANGNLSTKTAPSPNQPSTGTAKVTTTYTYDALNRLTGKSYSDTYTSNLATPSVIYGYDGVKPTCPIPIVASFSGGAAANNQIGRRTAMCNSAASNIWSYDPMGRIHVEAPQFNWLVPPYNSSFLYNDNGVEVASGNITYSYLGNGDPACLWSPAWNAWCLTENAAGQIASAGDALFNVLTLPTYTPTGQLAHAWASGQGTSGAMQITNTYNNRLQPVNLAAVTSTGSSILNLTYNFNAGNGTTGSGTDNGNVIQIANNKDSNRTQNFLYDSLNRIQQAYTNGPTWGETFSASATAPGVPPSTLGVDGWGNLIKRSGVTGKTNYEPLNCSANVRNQLTSCAFTYDAAGNMIANGTASYVFDAENRLIATAGLSYVYDGDGNRIEKCTELVTSGVPKPGQCAANATGTLYWLKQGAATLNESDLGANFTAAYNYIHGQIATRVDKPSNTVHYYFRDHLGSTSIVTDASGNIQKESDYYPYGGEIVITNNDSNRYKFTGKERDSESGLDYFGARHYASTMGRFMTPDPAGAAFSVLSAPQSWNMYSYVQNNPLSFTDPDGRECVWDDGSFDSKDDAQTGSIGGCTGAGGHYFEPSTFTAGNGQDWSSTPNTDIALQVAASPPYIDSPANSGNSSSSGTTTTINLFGSNFDITQVRQGTHPWRDNNPGDIVSGPFTSRNGQLGTDGRFAVFPTSGTGREAMDTLLHGGGYINLSINDAVDRYAPAFENNTASYQQFLTNALGVSGNTPLSSLSAAQFETLENAISRVEGFNANGNYAVTTTTIIQPVLNGRRY